MSKLPDTGSITWDYTDVQSVNPAMYKLTDDQAREILQIVIRKHDANVGICWEVIACHIDMYLMGLED